MMKNFLICRESTSFILMNLTGDTGGLFKWKNKISFLIIIGFKLVLAAVFSSDYQDKLFMPFISHFLSHWDDPWQYFYQNHIGIEFPYHPVMLYLLSFFYAPIYYIFGDNIILGNLFFKLPVLLADIMIFKLLQKTFTSRQNEIIIFYFASPIIIYASYIHSQLDLIPTSILFLSIYFLTKNHAIKAAVFFGIAVSIKLHVLAAVPLLIIYLLRKDMYKEIFYFFFISTGIYMFFLFPYLKSEGFMQLVLNNPKQKSVFNSTVMFSNVKILLPLFASIVVYTRFLIYKKINNDLLFTFFAILFSLFVILIPPSPAWYIWIFPFLSIFFIKNYAANNKIIYLYGLLNFLYIIFFIFFYIPDYHDINFLGHQISIKILNPDLGTVFFTMLAAILLACIYAFYNFGVRSNSIYRKGEAMIIGIGGDSGSGKTTLLSDMKLILGSKITDIEGDGDHKWERNHKNWEEFTHLDPKANLLHKQSEELLTLKHGKDIYRPEYDHHSGNFTKPKLVKSNEYIAICGLHPFYLPIMRKIIDLKIFINTDEKLRIHWKILRDIKKRGYSQEQILQQIEKREDDSLKYIAPQMNFADVVISYFTENNFIVGDETAQPEIKLKIVLHADLNVEPLLKIFIENNIPVIWNYAEDLHTQYFIIEEKVDTEVVKNIAKEVIVNLEELIPHEVEWVEGYRGVVQLIVLFVLSDRLKAANFDKPLYE